MHTCACVCMRVRVCVCVEPISDVLCADCVPDNHGPTPDCCGCDSRGYSDLCHCPSEEETRCDVKFVSCFIHPEIQLNYRLLVGCTVYHA